MKPKLLKIEGLNSFQQQETINFDKLMLRGLFGIFGATGSGKSTVLDAIILALYGNIPRNSRDFINSDSDIAYVYFEFELNNNSEYKTYVTERSFKKKKEGGYNCKFARIYEKDLEKNINIIAEDSKAVNKYLEDLIGLKVDDFTRTVVLPQGKFSEFLSLQPKYRNDMLERILHLEEYGKNLETKIKSEKNKTDIEVKLLNSKIETYKEITEEKFNQEKANNLCIVNLTTNLKQEKQKVQESFNIAKELWELEKEKIEYKNYYEEILKDEEKISIQKNHLSSAIKADIVYKYIKDLEETEKKLNVIIQDLEIKTLEYNYILCQSEQIQKSYNIAKDIKESEYEILLKKEENLKQAIEILSKVSILEDERKNFQYEYDKYDKEYKKFKIQKIEIENNIEKVKKDLENIISNKSKLNIDPERKEEIEKAYQYENKYNDITNILEDITQKIINYNIQLKEIEKQQYEFQENIEKLETEISILEQQLSKLNEKDYSNSDILLDLQSNCNTISIEYNDIKQKEQIKKELQIELEEINITKQQQNENFNIQTKQLEELNKKSENINEQIKALEIINKFSILSQALKENEPCPVCGSTNHPCPAKRIEDSMVLIASENFKRTKNEYLKVQATINKLLTNIEVVDKEYEKISKQLLSINEQLKEKTSEQLLEEKEKLIQKFEQLKKDIDLWNKQMSIIQEAMIEKREQKNKLNLKNTRIIERQLRYIQDKQENESEQQRLIQQKENLKNAIDIYKENLGINDFKNERIAMILNEKERLNLEKLETNSRQKIILYENGKTGIIDKIITIEKEMDKIVERNKEKTNTIKKYNIDIEILSENNEPNKHIIIVREKLKKIFQNEKNLYIKLEDINLEKQNIINICTELKKEKDILLELKLEKHINLQKSLKDNDFNSIEYVKSSIIEKTKQTLMSETISKYEHNYNNIINNIDRLDKKLSGRTIEKREWESINKNLEKLNKQLEQSTQQMAVSEERILIIEKNLKEVQRLEKDKKQLVHKQDLLEELIKLIKGNGFVKFVSQRQMRYISREATKYLKKITKDRYAIEIDDESDFIMRDDFLGGIRRKPNTLSGGEIFITSLSLALALSSQIQLKNKAPLEFFFLDEGFGSLDMELLDIVIGALEKLHSEHMSIGIISHIEELKNRIPVKLIVTSAQQGIEGSKIKLELT